MKNETRKAVANPGKTSPSAASAPERSLHEVSLSVQYAIFAIALVSLILSAFAAIKTVHIAKIIDRQAAGAGGVLKKLTSHPDAAAYFGVKPLAVIQVDQSNIENLAKQITGLDPFWLGRHLVQYGDTVFVYDYAQDRILQRIN